METFLPILRNICHSQVIIQSKNISFMSRYHLNIRNDHNLQLSHILCFQETIVKYYIFHYLIIYFKKV